MSPTRAPGSTPPPGSTTLGQPWPVAYARLRAGEAYVAAGDRVAAAAPLVAARTAAEAMEADAAGGRRGRARAPRARAHGCGRARAQRRRPSAPLGLTPREHQVLLLVAEGRTNREIGAELFMSEKTASVHVSRILAKLDVGGRVEAAAVAHRLGMTAR